MKSLLLDLRQGSAYYCLSAIVVLIGIALGYGIIEPLQKRHNLSHNMIAACVRYDGYHYRDIADHGYQYNSNERSTVAFFPVYPFLSYIISSMASVESGNGLLLVANTALLGSFFIMARYLRIHPAIGEGQSGWILLIFALWPSTFFFRMAYAESLFILLTVSVFYGMARGWPLLPLGMIAGLASATRPVGIAVSIAYLWFVVYRPVFSCKRIRLAILLCPLSCWGLLAYMIYLYFHFGNPLAFASTQQHWTYRAPLHRPEWSEQAGSLLSMEPIIGVYDPTSTRYWKRYDKDIFLFNLAFWNPLLYLCAVGLVIFGCARRWLSGPEIVYSAVALAIPYVTRAYEMSMASHGRFAAAIVPAYLVAGKLLSMQSPSVAAAFMAISAALLCCWSSLFVAGSSFF